MIVAQGLRLNDTKSKKKINNISNETTAAAATVTTATTKHLNKISADSMPPI